MRLSTTRLDRGRAGQPGGLLRERHGVEREVPDDPRPARRRLPLRRDRRQRPREQRRRDEGDLQPQALDDLRPVRADRDLRQRRLRLPLERRPRRDDALRPEHGRARFAGHAARPGRSRGGRRAEPSGPGMADDLRALGPRHRLRARLRRGRRDDRAVAAEPPIRHRVVELLPHPAVAVARPRSLVLEGAVPGRRARSAT